MQLIISKINIPNIYGNDIQYAPVIKEEILIIGIAAKSLAMPESGLIL